MDLQQRINILEEIGKYISENGEEWQIVKQNAARENAWFTLEFIEIAAKNITQHFLNKDLLQEWANQYEISTQLSSPKNVGIVMAGNIPLVGFHDFLCVFISGNVQTIKTSSKDTVLIKHLVKKMYELDVQIQNVVSFSENLKGCDAYIATGSNNTGRYFDYYFGKYPNIIRNNRTSVAILDGSETDFELKALANDIQLYFGLGCRNVTKLYVPTNYNFIPLLETLKQYDYFFEFHKYKHNYDYQLALLMLSNQFYMTNGSIVLAENTSIFSPVSQVNYQYYNEVEIENLYTELQENESVQCVVGKKGVEFGKAQQPSLIDYADGVDTLQFLKSLS